MKQLYRNINITVLTVVFLVAVTCAFNLGASDATVTGIGQTIPMQTALDKLGIVHQAGQYYFDKEKDFLNEGAGVIRNELGAKNIKVMLNAKLISDPLSFYAFNTQWADCQTLLDIAQTPQFSQLFASDFQTFVLTAHDANDTAWSTGFTSVHSQQTEEEMYQLAVWLLTQYAGSSKTFIIQNWEGDNLFAHPHYIDINERTPQQYNDFAAWLNARNDGIIRARQQYPNAGVNLYYAIEVNRISYEPPGTAGKWLIDTILPYTYADLYSYSCWENITTSAQMQQNINTLKQKSPDSVIFGNDNVYVGEIGMAEQSETASAQQQIVKSQLEGSILAGSKYVFYWQLYCNERIDLLKDERELAKYQRPENGGMNGFWLIRADGTYTNTWFYLKGLLSGVEIPVDTGLKKNVLQHAAGGGANAILNPVLLDDMGDSSNLARPNGYIQSPVSGITFASFSAYNYANHFSKYGNDKTAAGGDGYLIYERHSDTILIESFADTDILHRLSVSISNDNGQTFASVQPTVIRCPQRDSFWRQFICAVSLAENITHIKIQTDAPSGWEVQITKVAFQNENADMSILTFDDMLDYSEMASHFNTVTEYNPQFAGDDKTYIKRFSSGAGDIVYAAGGASGRLVINTAQLLCSAQVQIYTSGDGGASWAVALPRVEGVQQAEWQWSFFVYSYTFSDGVDLVKIIFDGNELYDPLILSVQIEYFEAE